MTSPLRTVTVATAGLDLLHGTRIKLACSLLMADRIEVQLVPWQEQPVDLLVCGVDDAEGSRAHHVAHTRQFNVLAISRQMASSTVDGLAHGVTVRDLNAILRQRLSAAHVVAAAPPTPVQPLPRLLQLLRDAREEQVLTCGGLLLRHQPFRSSLLLPSTTTLQQVLAMADNPGWQIQATAPATLPLSPRRVSVESLLFAAAATGVLPGAQVDPHQRVQLRAWPELEAELVPVPLLMAIACLHAHAWSAAALALRCDLPLGTLQALFAAADATGLARHEHIHAPVAPVTVAAPAASDARFLSRLARRLGLRLFETN